MAKISLRAYLHDIEILINSGQNEEALAHCRHILKYYPRLLAAYRLMGKCFLEMQRYADAADIFERVLSAVPDDFVSQVGMSIIREDENNLDAAIWHMERAFEAQPYNAAIQDELRRLYGRRDGIEPPKARLTRGALARMYARGDLYQQAIAELRAAMAEDPQRPDLQVLLARVYFLSGMKVEAVEICNTVLKKYPNCIEANRIISAILPQTDRKEDAQLYRQRVLSLDPYLGLAEPGTDNTENIPDSVATLERLDYHAQPAGPGQPAWAASLGVNFDNKEDASVPDWLSGADEAKPPVLGASAGTGEETPQTPGLGPIPWSSQGEESAAPDGLAQTEGGQAQPDQENIPDWMKQAGWGASTGEAVEGPVKFEDETGAVPGAEGEAQAASEGEIPDWLKAMKPEEESLASQIETPAPEKGAEEVLPWLQEKQPGPSETIVDWLAEEKGAPAPASNVDSVLPTEEGIPDWLAGLGSTPAKESPDAAQPGEAAPAEVPDWLSEPGPAVTAAAPAGETAQTSEAAPVDVPDWLSSVGPAAEGTPETAQPVSPTDAAPVEVPDWLGGIGADEDTLKAPEAVQPAETPPASVTDWLASLDKSEAAPAAEAKSTSEVPAEAAPAEVPDWLSGLGPSAEVTPQAEETAQPVEAEVPDWLGEPKSVEGAPKAEEAVQPVEPSPVEVPDWLASLPASEEPPIIEPPQPVQAAPAEVPDWLSGLAPAGAEPPAAPEAAQPAEAAPAEVPDWLSGLAPAEEGERAPEAAQPPEAAPTEVPDWLSSLGPSEEAPAPQGTPAADRPAEAAPADVPDWLASMAPAQEAPQQVQPAEAPAAEIPAAPAESVPPAGLSGTDAALAWLESLAAKQGVPEDQLTSRPEDRPVTPPTWTELVAEAQPQAETGPVEAAQDWMKEFTSAEGSEEGAPLEAELTGELPDWLNASEAEIPAAQGPAETPVEPPEAQAAAEPAELPGWLKAAEAEIPVVEPPAETPVETPVAEGPAEPAVLPDWLKAAEAEIPAEGTPAEPAAELQDEEPIDTTGLPDWLSGPSTPAENAPEGAVPAAETPVKTEPAAIPAMPDLSNPDAALAWLESLAAKQGVPEEQLPTLKAQAPAAPPEPVGQVTPLSDTQPIKIVRPVEESKPVQIPAAEIPAPAVESQPDWLKEVEAEIPAEAVEAAPVSETPLERIPAAEPAMPDLSSPDAAMAWLESLAAKQGAPEEELTTRPEERPAAPPTWVQEIPSEAPMAEVPVAEKPAEEPPVWLKEIEAETPEGAAAETPQPVIEQAPVEAPETVKPIEPVMPDLSSPDAAMAWLESLAAKQGVPEEELTTRPEERPAAPPTWVQEIPAEAPAAEVPAAEAPVEEKPDWLKEIEAETPEEAFAPKTEPAQAETLPPATGQARVTQAPAAEKPAEPAMPDLSSPDAAMAWLESLAAKQGVPEEQLTTKPEERVDTPPAWVQEIPAEAPAAEKPEAEPEAVAPPIEAAQPPVQEELPAVIAEEARPEEPAPDLPSWLAEPAAEEPADEVISWKLPEVPAKPGKMPIEAAKLRKYDLNKASLVELENLPGIGFIMAQKIIAYRDANGPFATLVRLMKVDGFNPAILDDLKDRLFVEPGIAEQAVKPVKAVQPPVEPEKPAVYEIPEGLDEFQKVLALGRRAIDTGQVPEMVEHYTRLIKQRCLLDDVVHDLNTALGRYPKEIGLWQALGDACMRNNQLLEAMEAYSKAEELLR